jgi:hypothetical protein
MLLYAHVPNTLIEALHDKLPGVRIGRRTHTSVAAYADDVTVFLTSQEDIPTLCEVLTSYEKATGAKINKAKSRIMALDNWDTSINILDIPYSAAMSILGTQITTSIKLTCELSWEKVTNLIQAKAQRDYARRLTFDARMRFIHEQLYAHVWYLVQLFPPSPGSIRQLQMTSSRFLWEGEIFRLPLSTL